MLLTQHRSAILLNRLLSFGLFRLDLRGCIEVYRGVNAVFAIAEGPADFEEFSTIGIRSLLILSSAGIYP